MAQPPQAGRWLWTCRAGFEGELYQELAAQRAAPRLLGAALVESDAVRGAAPAFARMGFLVERLARTSDDAAAALPASGVVVQAWVPDTDEGNLRAKEARAWEEALVQQRREAGAVDYATPWKAHEGGGFLGQVCLLAPGVAAVGAVRAREAFSLAPGGRARMKRSGEAPSRAAMKLEEALEWYGLAPGRGDECVDLGAAPGGWTRVVAQRGARVWAVDPAKLADDVRAQRGVRHVQASAFSYAPDEPVDWLFCDMAWRPLEVAQLLGKWARNRWALHLVANVKLPMKDRLPMVQRVRAVLEDAGWRHLRVRQLYHDRDEVTVSARSRCSSGAKSRCTR